MINVSETAASKISELLTEENKAGSGLRVFVQGGGCSGFQYGLMIEESGQGVGDQVYESHGVKLFVDPISVRYLNGAEVDFVDTVTGGVSRSRTRMRRRLAAAARRSRSNKGHWTSPACVRPAASVPPNATASSIFSCARKVT